MPAPTRPTIVGNIRIDQAWGLFQISAAAHNVDASYKHPDSVDRLRRPPCRKSPGNPDDKWGGSVMAGVEHQEHPDRSPATTLKIDASYAKGDTKKRDRHLW